MKLAKDPSIVNHNLSSLNTIFSGAAPLSAELSFECMKKLNCAIRQGYGMTETSPVTHSSPANPAKMRLGSVGPPAPNTECKLIDPATGEELGVKQEGEVCVRGPQIMRGYLNNAEATARTIDADDGYTRAILATSMKRVTSYRGSREGLIKYKGFQMLRRSWSDPFDASRRSGRGVFHVATTRPGKCQKHSWFRELKLRRTP